MANDVKPRQQFVVRSYKCRDFQLSGSTSAFNWKKSTCSPPSWIPQKMEVLHFKQNIRLKDWFLSIPNGLVIKKDFTSHMIIGHTRELSNKKKKSIEGVQLSEAALPKVQTWTANGERERWSLVMWLLDVCGHTFLGTNVDLKLPCVSLHPAV